MKWKGVDDMRNKKKAIAIAVAIVVAAVAALAYMFWFRDADGVPDIDSSSQSQPIGGSETQGDGQAAPPQQPTQGGIETETEIETGDTSSAQSVQSAHRGPYLGSDIVARDVPAPAGLPEGRTVDEVRDLIVSHIKERHPGITIDRIALIGSGSAPSQWLRGESETWMSYVVTMSDGNEIGLAVSCATSTKPYLSEGEYLHVRDKLNYDVKHHIYAPYEYKTDDPQQQYLQQQQEEQQQQEQQEQQQQEQQQG